MHPTITLRIIGILLLLSTSSFNNREPHRHLPLNGGCITTSAQCVLYGAIPATINATVASDGVAGTYAYQWQSSTDNINFTDIVGATSQNLSFSSPLAQTTWFQRKTTSGAEVAYTGTTKIELTETLFYNTQKSGTFTRNNCGPGATGGSYTYTVPANTHSSCISQFYADSLAMVDVNTNGQNEANTYGQCTWYNVQKSGTYTKNNCGPGGVGSQETYTVNAGTYSSTVSQFYADSLAQAAVYANGQTHANNIGSCTYYSEDQSDYYYNQTCGEGSNPEPWYVSMPAGSYTSTSSLEDANNQAREAAQNEANTYGSCGYVDIYYNSETYDYAEFYNTMTGEYFYFYFEYGYNNYLGQLPEGIYDITFYGDGYYRYYSTTCSGYDSGNYNITLYSVTLNSGCNFLEITDYPPYNY